MWLLYLYFIRAALIDLYDLAIDAFHWAVGGTQWQHLPAISRFFDTLKDYTVVAIANGSLLIVWAFYNWYRFSGSDRHGPGNPVNVADLAALYNVPVADVEYWQDSRILEMRHDADGTLAEVIVKDPAHTLLTPPRSSITSLAAAHVPPIEPAPPSEQPG